MSNNRRRFTEFDAVALASTLGAILDVKSKGTVLIADEPPAPPVQEKPSFMSALMAMIPDTTNGSTPNKYKPHIGKKQIAKGLRRAALR